MARLGWARSAGRGGRADPLVALSGALGGDWSGILLFAAVLVLAPLVLTSSYHHGVLITFCINLILLVGLNLIAGYAQQLSLGHAGFYGLGAYTAGVATAKLGWPPAVAFLLAPVVTGAVALVVGIPSLRLRGLYFAMATLGAGTVLFLIFGRAVEVTGGPNGLLGIPRFGVLGLQVAGPLGWYWPSAAFALLGIVGTRNLLRSRAGRGLRALGISEAGAAAVGVNAFRAKLVVFVATAAYAGVAGAIQAFQARFVGPETFNFFTTVIFVVILVLSGAGTLWGPLVGALLLTGLDELLTGYHDYKPLFLGLAFLVVLRVFPRGMVGELEALVGRLREQRRAAAPVARGETRVRPHPDTPATADPRLDPYRVAEPAAGERE